MSRLARVIITGASSGIGRAIAVRLSTPGTTIINLDVADGATTESLCEGPVHTINVDLADTHQVGTAFDEADRRFESQPPDLLVCCAALSRQAAFLDVSAEDLDRLLDVNVKGTFHSCQAAARRMVPAREGRIVVITSISAVQGWARESVYCITKGAQQALVASLAVELAPFNILVNAVAPGIIDMTGDSMAKTRTDPDVFRHDMERTPTGRFGSPGDVASAVQYLARVDWMTGQTIFVDGGFMATGLGYFGESKKRLLDDE